MSEGISLQLPVQTPNRSPIVLWEKRDKNISAKDVWFGGFPS